MEERIANNNSQHVASVAGGQYRYTISAVVGFENLLGSVKTRKGFSKALEVESEDFPNLM